VTPTTRDATYAARVLDTSRVVELRAPGSATGAELLRMVADWLDEHPDAMWVSLGVAHPPVLSTAQWGHWVVEVAVDGLVG
jgi:hypothetical protein